MDPAATVQYITLPSGAVIELAYRVTFGEILLAAVVTLQVVLFFGWRLLDRIRGVT